MLLNGSCCIMHRTRVFIILLFFFLLFFLYIIFVRVFVSESFGFGFLYVFYVSMRYSALPSGEQNYTQEFSIVNRAKWF